MQSEETELHFSCLNAGFAGEQVRTRQQIGTGQKGPAGWIGW